MGKSIRYTRKTFHETSYTNKFFHTWKKTNLKYLDGSKSLFQWKIVNNNRCDFCGNEEDYLHYFITCSFFKTFWEKIYNLFKSNNLEFTLKLKHLIFDYKISDNDYYGVNYFITILGFSIYKSLFI